MAVEIKGRLIGTCDTELIHPSGATLRTTPPKDNQGDGTLFSPTDLFASSLASCAVTILGLYANKSNIALGGVDFEIIKEMSQSPRKISKICVQYIIDTDCDDSEFEKLVRAAKTCPVRKTIEEVVCLEETYMRKKRI